MSTAYQIRESLLHLARDILESQSRAKKQFGSNTCYPHGDDLITSDQIISEAKKLNDFVSQSPPVDLVERIRVLEQKIAGR